MTKTPQSLPHRTIIELNGPDTIALLERTVTHSVSDWEANEWRHGGLLTPQGKLIADYLALRTDQGVLIDVHSDASADLQKRLKMFRLRSDVHISESNNLTACIHEVGSKTAAPDPRHPALPQRSIDAVSIKPQTDAQKLYDELRMDAGVPEWGSDYEASEVFPTDINMDVMQGVDYHKGCFVGQEVVSRMKRRGKIRKRTLKVKGKDLSKGSVIKCGEATIGTVTSVLGGDGLAIVRLDRLPNTTEPTVSVEIDDQIAELHLSDWIMEEMSALQVDG